VTGPRVTALLLDLDGTLVDSEPLHRARYRTWFAHRGWAYDDSVAAQFTGRRADDVFRTVDGPWNGEDPDALLAEIVVQSHTIATEAQGGPFPDWLDERAGLLGERRHTGHNELKAMLPGVRLAVRTGEETPYANVVLECGVPFG
jgi:beta-phosphoglucomutase-like phosphatase (HAD superfamily)